MIRITRETDYAVVILSLMTADSERRYSAAWVAEQGGLPQPVVSKVLKMLARAGLLVSYRGAKGGYGFARSPREISIADVIAAIEGPISFTECVEVGELTCQYSSQCVMSTNWNRINQVVQTALESISLQDMTQPLPLPTSDRSREVFVSLSSLTNG